MDHHQQSSTSSPPSRGPPPSTSLARFGSAPGSFLSTLVDATSGELPGVHPSSTPPARTTSRFFAGGGAGESPCLTSESTCKAPDLHHHTYTKTAPKAAADLDIGLHRPYGHVGSVAAAADPAVNGGGGGGGGGVGGGSSALFRHSSSPAGFLSHLMMDGTGFSVTRGGEYSQTGNQGIHGVGNGGLKSQLSFSSRQDSLSHLSEMSIPEDGEGHGSNDANAHPCIASGFQISSWDEPNSIIFSAHSGKRGRGSNGTDIAAALSSLDSQYGLSKTALDVENVENLFQIQQDSVPCKMRAKRGCATHPRSIAERERRTRISEKLKKLQELVPNMDKQTSTADMLDLAVQHIKGLQSQVQRLNQECAGCTCGSKQDI